MSESLVSPQWFRVSALHPRLRPQVQVHRQPSRGQNWYVLHNTATGRFHRVHARAYELVGRLDGHLSLDEVWRALVNQLGDNAPTQDEALGVLAQLADGDLLQAEEMPDLRRLIAQSKRHARVEQRARINPLSFRVSLFDPTPWMRRAGPLSRAVFSAPVAWLWLALMCSGAWLAWTHQPELSGHMAQALGQPRMLMWMWLVYPVMKALHEAAHALALRRFGCHSHEVGVTFLLLMPLPHVDATDALRLVNRWQRATVVAAGMAAELTLAALAVWVWTAVAPGLVRDLALLVMVLGGASTLLFNGNPLMRYDGYHLLCDVMDLPNLGPRSARHWRQRMQGWLVRVVGRSPRATAGVPMDTRERWALWVYAPASWWWRLVVAAMVMQWVAHWSPWLSWAVGLWMAWSLLLRPITAWVRESVDAPELGTARERARWMLIGLLSASVAAVMWWPWSPSLSAQGLVWMPQEATLRSPHPARVEALLVSDGQRVVAGQPLMRLSSQELEAEIKVVRARIAALEAERSAAWGREPVRVRQAQEALRRDVATLQDLEQRQQRLMVTAPQAGAVVLPGGGDGLGRDVQQGDLLAHVLPVGGARVLAVIPEDDVGLWRNALRSRDGQGVRPEVLVSDERGEVRQARLLRQAPAALERLPTVALGATQGGSVQTDPADPDGLKPLRPVFVIELDVPDRSLARVGARAQVKLSLPAQSLADQLVFRFRQLLLRQFAQLA